MNFQENYLEKIRRWIKNNPLILVILMGLAIGGGTFVYMTLNDADKNGLLVQETISSEDLEQSSSEESQNLEDVLTTIYVDVKGEVNKPGVYALSPDSRIFDAIEAAGGMTEHAAEESINLAKRLEDQMVIYIQNSTEWASAIQQLDESTELNAQRDKAWGMSEEGESETEQTLVNINTADQTALESLPGIGPKKAQAIIQYRIEHGSFQQIEAIEEVAGIGHKTFEGLKDLITVGQ